MPKRPGKTPWVVPTPWELFSEDSNTPLSVDAFIKMEDEITLVIDYLRTRKAEFGAQIIRSLTQDRERLRAARAKREGSF